MSRKDEKDLERPHYYSQFWINQAREAAGQPINFSNGDGGLTQVLDREDEDFDVPLMASKIAPAITDTLDDLDELPLPPPPAPKPIKQKAPTPQRAAPLSSFADLATLGFGKGAETDELAISADDSTEDIMSRIESEFELSNEVDVVPDEEEAASLETLSEAEGDLWEEEEEDDDALPRRGAGPRPKIPPRRPQRRDF